MNRSIKTPLPLALILGLFTAAISADAGGRPAFTWTSDTHIRFSKIEKVTMAKDTITFIGNATITRPIASPGLLNVTRTKNGRFAVTGQNVTFVVKRPPIDYNDDQLQSLLADKKRAAHAKRLDESQFRYQRGGWWRYSLTVSKTIQNKPGSQLLRYSRPKLQITDGKVTGVTGYAFFIPRNQR